MADKIQIRSRWDSDTVLFECEAPEGLESGLYMRHALEKATEARADLRGADLSGADLRGADLRGADLRGADLRGADLGGADLRGAYLRDAYLRDADGNPLPRATPEQAIESLDKVRAIVLDDQERLNMGHWHGSDEWKNRTCAEEAICGTTHCLAGWLQVCTTEPALKNIDPQLAGTLAAPVAAKMFFRGNEEALEWLRDRKYVAESAEAEQRAQDRAARRAAEGEQA
ncbi:Pentapeptide repeat-containing protein [Variovorax sp. NFACC29]|nr:Pentapeptide repeat-containing protein [Variovorax sp. NFACC29]